MQAGHIRNAHVLHYTDLIDHEMPICHVIGPIGEEHLNDGRTRVKPLQPEQLARASCYVRKQLVGAFSGSRAESFAKKHAEIMGLRDVREAVIRGTGSLLHTALIVPGKKSRDVYLPALAARGDDLSNLIKTAKNGRDVAYVYMPKRGLVPLAQKDQISLLVMASNKLRSLKEAALMFPPAA
jgi:hypothetical protein